MALETKEQAVESLKAIVATATAALQALEANDRLGLHKAISELELLAEPVCAIGFLECVAWCSSPHVMKPTKGL
jgi:hypothetical protein